MNIRCEDLFSLDKTITKDWFYGLEYPWEILEQIGERIIKLGQSLSKDKFDYIGNNIWLAKSAKIYKTAHIEGPAIVDEYAKIRHCAYIRNNVIIGKYAVVGNSTELKNVILFDNVQTPHYNYVGDSILGYKAHLGAGAITSNVKGDKSFITIKNKDIEYKTNYKKLGAILGDYVEVGCNAVLNPGTIIGKNSTIYPVSMVRGCIEENSIYKNKDEICRKV